MIFYKDQFGNAIADKIVDDASYANSNVISQVSTDAINNVKTQMNLLALNYNNAMRERSNKIAEAKALADPQDMADALQKIKDIDSGGWFTPSLQSQVDVMRSVLNTLGVSTTIPDPEALGFFVIDDLAEVTAAAWIAGVTIVAVIAAAATYFGTQALRYTALVINPNIVDPTATTAFAESLGGGAKVALIIAALGAAAYFIMEQRKKA